MYMRRTTSSWIDLINIMNTCPQVASSQVLNSGTDHLGGVVNGPVGVCELLHVPRLAPVSEEGKQLMFIWSTTELSNCKKHQFDTTTTGALGHRGIHVWSHLKVSRTGTNMARKCRQIPSVLMFNVVKDC